MNQTSGQHTLTIGATGMLAGATIALAREGACLSVVARSERSVEEINSALSGSSQVNHVVVADWNDREKFLRTIAAHITTVGFPNRVIAWVHDDELGPKLAEVVSSGSATPCEFFHVRGSAAANPAEDVDRFLDNYEIPSDVAYYQIVLGFQRSSNRSRWLTHEEISTGVIEAVQNPRPVTIVGTVTPWSERP